ncbi:hypothetical protein Plhal304r1_c063g0150821 [Plasmopara halstedii]
MLKESIVAVYVTTPTNTVVESDCGSVGITDHEGDAPTRFVVELTHVQEPTEFADRGIDTPAQPESYANILPYVMDATTGCEVTRTNILLAPLPTMKEPVQLEKVTCDGSYTMSSVITLRGSCRYSR